MQAGQRFSRSAILPAPSPRELFFHHEMIGGRSSKLLERTVGIIMRPTLHPRGPNTY